MTTKRTVTTKRSMTTNGVTRSLIGILLVYLMSLAPLVGQESVSLCKIVVRDKSTKQPVPMVELRTTSELRYVTDNAGVVAFDAPEFMNRETWFHVHGHGYQSPKDGFGMRGVRVTPRPNSTITIEVERAIIAERLGRLTGSGLLAESQKLGEHLDRIESGIVGCDSVQMTEHQGRGFWNWGDTNIARYPLGNFHMSGAYTDLNPFSSIDIPIRVYFQWILKDNRDPKPMAPIAGKGPTWLTGYVSLRDDAGEEHLVACYRKIKPPLDTHEIGLCEWDQTTKEFKATKIIWREAEGKTAPSLIPEGHTVRWKDSDGQRWVLFGNPFPSLRIRDDYAVWSNPSEWQSVQTPERLESVNESEVVKPHSGSIAWNAYRQRWVTVFMQKFGKPSAFGEVWYAESDSPMGPWGRAVKILSHDNYTFYNPRVHGEFSPKDSSMLLFEGTYTHTFANKPSPTPRYDYNQILYRLDLNDSRLEPTRK